MKALLIQLARYNFWANQQLIATIERLTPELQQATVKSSFVSLQATLLHMWDAESIWWQRLRLVEKTSAPSNGFNGTTMDIANSLMQQDKQWLQWIEQSQEHVLEHEFIYQNSKKEIFKQPTYQMLIHLFNHSTYHRGQLVAILHQLGVPKIPATDFIVWSRKKQ